MPRRCGKTYQLIQKSAMTGDRIVCRDLQNCRLIKKYSDSLGLTIPHPISYHQFLELRNKKSDISGVLIDNVDDFVQSLTNVKVNAITLTP